MQSQTNTKKAVRPERRAQPRPEFIAAVRYRNGRRELFTVKNAIDLADARELVLIELPEAAAVMIAPRH